MNLAELQHETTFPIEILTEQDAESQLRHLAHISMGGLEAPTGLDWAQEIAWEAQSGMDDGMYRMLLEQLPVVTFLARLGSESNEMYVSPQIEEMLGFSQREWLDNPILWYERLHSDDKARWNVDFARFLIFDDPFRAVYRFIARDGHIVWVRGEVRKIRDEQGRPIIIQGIGYDITEIKEAEEKVRQASEQLERRVEERTAELAESNAALLEEIEERKRSQEELERAELQLLHSAKLASLGTLATGVAHELNQPLAVIRGTTQQLMHEAGLSEDCMEDLALIEGQTQRMMKIINHLRTFARAPSGEIQRTDINQVAKNCLILIGEQLKSNDIRVEFALCEEPAEALVDTNELEQVVLNLVTNARDALAGRPDTRITLRSRVEESQVVLEVADNGPGVPEACVSRIMDPFFTTKEAGKGTGLGLSISHSIVARHHGSLEYRTENGAVFTVILPKAP